MYFFSALHWPSQRRAFVTFAEIREKRVTGEDELETARERLLSEHLTHSLRKLQSLRLLYPSTP